MGSFVEVWACSEDRGGIFNRYIVYCLHGGNSSPQCTYATLSWERRDRSFCKDVGGICTGVEVVVYSRYMLNSFFLVVPTLSPSLSG